MGSVQFIPIPENKPGRKAGVEYKKVSELVAAPIGGCVTFPAGTLGIKSVRKLAQRLSGMAYSLGGPGWVTTRYYDGGVGLWKVDHPTKLSTTEGTGAVVAPVRAGR